MKKLRVTLTFLVAVQLALALSAGAMAGKNGKDKATTSDPAAVLVEYGFHRGGR